VQEQVQVTLDHGQWRIGVELDSGGFGRVYEASKDEAGMAVAKLIPKAPGASRELLFEELSGLPNIVPILDFGETETDYVLVMPRAEKSLRQHLDETSGPLATDEATSILLDIVLALALAALEGNVVHRDLKPENVLLLEDHWCIADFGIARYAEKTTAPDTHKYAWSRAYAAPEQWKLERATAATDVYALGVRSKCCKVRVRFPGLTFASST
jgi:eukaryotic-like serine/threonine-protein kinase